MDHSTFILNFTFILLFKWSIQGNLILASKHPTTSLTQGMVLGNLAYSRDGRSYFEFLGIPYGMIKEKFAVSLICLNPIVNIYLSIHSIVLFKMAEAPQKWQDGVIWNATRFGSKCLQFDKSSQTVIGSEQCLFINVYRPSVSTR